MHSKHGHHFDVLLLEDEPADVHLARIAFQEAGVKATITDVSDGTEGLSYLRRQGDYGDAPRPDLILLDLNMPRMNGKEFLSQIKADHDLKQIPIVVLTTSSSATDINSCYSLGASGYITKPVEVDDFIAAVSSLERYWFNLVRLP